MRNIKKLDQIIILFISFFIWTSCFEKRVSDNNVLSDTVYLPDTFRYLQSSDLRPILEMIGNAEIIGLSESSHYLNEPLDFRNELIKFLVKEKKIGVVAIESGIVESRYLFDYVNGGQEHIDSVLFKGVSWTFDRIPQNKELIEWLRMYNQDLSNSHKVKIYGFDIPGSPLNSRANRQINTSITAALEYLKIVDYKNWIDFTNRLDPLMEYLHINISNPEIKQYYHLGETERNELTAIVQDLIRLFKINELSYLNQTSKEDYDWGYHAAKSSRDVDNWLRTFPLGFELSSEISETVFSNFFWKLHGKRDQTMANNIEWIKAKEKNAKILLFGHINHISKSTQTLLLEDSTRIVKEVQLGQYLDSKYHQDYKVIGNFHFETKRPDKTRHADKNSFEKLLAQKDSINYCHLLSEKDKEWMNKNWLIGEVFLNAKTYMNPYQGIDILFFTPTQTEIVIN